MSAHPPSRNSWLVLLVFAALLLSAGKAAAEDTQAADDCMADPGCAELVDNARTFSKAGQYEASIVAYQSAYARKPVAWLLINIGRTQQRLGQLEPAIKSYRRYLQDAETASELREKAQQYLKEAEQELAAQKRVSVPQLLVPISGPAKRPRYKPRWWFWTLLGGAAAVVVIGTTVGVLSRQPDWSGSPEIRVSP